MKKIKNARAKKILKKCLEEIKAMSQEEFDKRIKERRL